MPALKPERPTPGVALVMPRVPEETTQRALDQVGVATQQIQGKIDEARAAIGEIESGRLLAETELTGTGSGTLNALTTRVRVRMVACGGGGGGAQGGANQAAGAGGSSGVSLDFMATVTPGGAFNWSAPTTGGTAGSSSGGDGGAGSDATLTLPLTTGSTTYTAKGGGGGQGMLNGTTGFAQPTAPAGGSSSGAGIRSTWTPGMHGVSIPQPYWYSGNGGASPFGSGTIGGNDGTGTGAGVTGGRGAGGSGATEKSGGSGKAGGSGGPAFVVIEEYS